MLDKDIWNNPAIADEVIARGRGSVLSALVLSKGAKALFDWCPRHELNMRPAV